MKPDALLLTGPTGSGKTPLGRMLEKKGLWNRRCVHFDFGKILRDAANGKANHILTKPEKAAVREALRSGVLLENETFPVARKLFMEFCRVGSVRDQDLVILNGLPRHIGQAEDMEALVRIRALAVLECPEQAVKLRIQTNSGGDRSGRADDTEEAVSDRLKRYRERTAPLIEYYRKKMIPVWKFPVGAGTAAGEIRIRMQSDEKLKQTLVQGDPV